MGLQDLLKPVRNYFAGLEVANAIRERGFVIARVRKVSPYYGGMTKAQQDILGLKQQRTPYSLDFFVQESSHAVIPDESFFSPDITHMISKVCQFSEIPPGFIDKPVCSVESPSYKTRLDEYDVAVGKLRVRLRSMPKKNPDFNPDLRARYDTDMKAWQDFSSEYWRGLSCQQCQGEHTWKEGTAGGLGLEEHTCETCGGYSQTPSEIRENNRPKTPALRFIEPFIPLHQAVLLEAYEKGILMPDQHSLLYIKISPHS